MVVFSQVIFVTIHTYSSLRFIPELNERMKGLMVDSSHNRFYGQSSDIMLVKTAMDIKRQAGEDKGLTEHLLAIKRPEYWNSHPVSMHNRSSSSQLKISMNQWHQPPPEAPDIYIFPEKDLMDSLMSCGSLFSFDAPFFNLPCSSIFLSRQSLHSIAPSPDL
jgi:hypothetical protein